MLALQKANDAAIVSILTGERNVENLLTKEWLLTNERGGYASSTIVGCNTSGYHGLLIGSLNPPANRIMALAKCLEMVISKGKVFNLSTFEFSDKFAPEGFTHLVQFRRNTGLHFDYELDKLELTKSVYLLRDTDTVALVYDFVSIEEPLEFVLRPFIGLRDFHTLQKSYAPLCSRWLGHSLLIRHDTPDSCELFLSCPAANFEKDEQWWFNFVYRSERQREQDFTEDLWTPGFFKCRIDSPTKIVLWANLTNYYNTTAGAPELNTDIEVVREDLRGHQNSVVNSLTRAKARDKNFRTLCLAADQFVIKRQLPDRKSELNAIRYPLIIFWLLNSGFYFFHYILYTRYSILLSGFSVIFIFLIIPL